MYRCACRTCDEETFLEEFAIAQGRFNDHASRAHEVELFNLNPTASTAERSVLDSTTGDGSERTDETLRGERTDDA